MTFREPSLSSPSVADSSAAGSDAARAGRVTHGALGYVLAYGITPIGLVGVTAATLGIGAAICAACGWMLAMLAAALCDSSAREACRACEEMRRMPLSPCRRDLLRDWVRRNWGRPGSTDKLIVQASEELGFPVSREDLDGCCIDLLHERTVEAMRTSRVTGGLCDAKA